MPDGLKLYNGDCLEVMPDLPDASVDLVLTDLPYGVTECEWDEVIPLAPLWAQYRRLVKPGAPIVLTSQQPFTTALIASNRSWFRYTWVWLKSNTTGFANAKRRPLKAYEEVLVFCGKAPPYNPQGLRVLERPRVKKRVDHGEAIGGQGFRPGYCQRFTGYPRNVLTVPSERGLHPTQKPVALMEYMIKTYTEPGAVVLDNTMGSGTTGVAAARTCRRFIGIERSPTHFGTASARIRAAYAESAAAAAERAA